jgi:1-aminocyclopropane-1-carboxylate deaminase/D-cysteine desulfhydrase-like pyridoxal-dependent ACC family enzyme
VSGPTPLERADRLATAIGMAPAHLWIERDDTSRLAGGANKVRKLEFLCAQALAGACDVMVTGAGPAISTTTNLSRPSGPRSADYEDLAAGPTWRQWAARR